MIKKIFEVIDGFKKTSIVYIIFLIFISLMLEMLSLGMIIPIVGYFESSDLNDVVILKSLFSLFSDYGINKSNIFNILLFSILTFFILRFLFLNYLTLKLHYFISTSNKLISEKLLKIYLSKDYSWHTENNKSNFVHLVTADVNNFCGNTLFGFLFITSELFLFSGVIIFLIFYNAKLFLSLLVVSCIFFPALYFFTKKYSYTLGENVRRNQNKLLRVINESLSGIKEMILYNWKRPVKETFGKTIKLAVRSAALHNALQDISRYIIELIAFVILLIFLYLINAEADSETNILTLGIFAGALFRLMPIMNRISTYAQRLKFGYPAVEKILEFYSHEVKSQEKKDLHFNENILFKNVSFKFKNSVNDILRNINLEVKKNDLIGIVGESGVGKTTLTNLLMGLIEPTEGQILVDNKNIRKENLSIGKNIGFVSQNFFHFDSNLLNNIVFFEKNINLNNLKFAIKNSLLQDTILNKTLSLKTNLGNNAMKISGGQLQRINIARALYRRPKILVLDEPTSSLDYKNQELFEKILINLKNKITIIVITHNLNFTKNLDKVYKLENKELKLIK